MAPSIPSKTVGILQLNYISWKGYFDLINLVDEFILYDDGHYTRQDWRNRNRIKTPDGLLWLTIPVQGKGKLHRKIREAVVSDGSWREKHWQSICHNYARAAYYPMYKPVFEELYLECEESLLSAVNYRFIVEICELLGITTRLSWSMDYDLHSTDKTERLVELCRQAGATKYLSGHAAKDYIAAENFADAGIDPEYFDYSEYPVHRQCYPPFEDRVSVVDLILNEGPDARNYMQSFSYRPNPGGGCL